MYCKMLIQFNNIYDFKNMKLGKDIYKSKNAGDIYIIQIDYLNYDYYKVGISSNLKQRIQDYRCGNTYEPRLYYYIPCRDIKAIDKELNYGLYEFNVKREIFNGEVENIKNKIISIVKNKYPSDEVKAYEPEIKIGDFTECNHCKKCFFNSLGLHEHFKICDEYKEDFNKYSNKKNICEYCNKLFSSYKNKWRHKKICKLKDSIINQNEILKKQNDELINKVEKLIEKVSNLEKNNMNYKNNYVNSFNKIQVNNYGCENIDYISDKTLNYNQVDKLYKDSEVTVINGTNNLNNNIDV